MITVTKMAKFYTKFNIQIFGGARRERTADLNTASVALSQLSYSPLNEFELLYPSKVVNKKISLKL